MINVRGREVSRIEGFSDAVFGFALTLLVVSLEVPGDFAGLKTILRGFLPFAVTFALVCWIWYEHYAFFRMFDVDDKITITLNCALLFIVLFFVYPLKFVFSNVVPMFYGERPVFMSMSADDNRMLMWVYSAGFAAMFAIFMLLYWNMYTRRERMQLSKRQVFEAWVGVRTHAMSVGVGLLSIVLAVTVPINWIWVAGAVYGLQGPLHWRNGVLIERARARAFPTSGAVSPVQT
ncbi:MAG TPA: TMEM175 family protein [Vicinamibacterales bacterium]